MSLFEFIVGMISVILALATAQLFIGVSELLLRRDRVRYFWPHSIWAVNLFLITYLHWWSLWTFRDLSWNFAMFFYSLLAPSLMFFLTAMISPRDRSAEVIDVKAHFLGIRQLFLSVFMIMLLLFALDGPLFGTEPWMNALRVFQIIVFALPIMGLVSKSPRVHLVTSLAILAGVVAVVIVRFLPGN